MDIRKVQNSTNSAVILYYILIWNNVFLKCDLNCPSLTPKLDGHLLFKRDMQRSNYIYILRFISCREGIKTTKVHCNNGKKWEDNNFNTSIVQDLTKPFLPQKIMISTSWFNCDGPVKGFVRGEYRYENAVKMKIIMILISLVMAEFRLFFIVVVSPTWIWNDANYAC